MTSVPSSFSVGREWPPEKRSGPLLPDPPPIADIRLAPTLLSVIAGSTELTMLVCSSVLGVLHLLVVAQFSRRHYGLKWIGSARDEPRPPMSGVGGRLERAYRNFLETFAYFVAAVAVVTISGQADRVSAWGAIAYFAGRLLYVPLYAAGVPVVRGLIWNIPTLGILAILATLLPGVS